MTDQERIRILIDGALLAEEIFDLDELEYYARRTNDGKKNDSGNPETGME